MRLVKQGKQVISIHAPPRGATLIVCDDVVNLNISIHAPPRGATALWQRAAKKQLFQFTPLREGRRECALLRWWGRISIHAPPRGATPPATRVRRAGRISIHAPPRGATGIMRLVKQGKQVISIHAPPRGATMTRSAGTRLSSYFNSRPSARGDNYRRIRGRRSFHFNSRPSARGDHLRLRQYRAENHFNSRPSARGDKKSQKKM